MQQNKYDRWIGYNTLSANTDISFILVGLYLKDVYANPQLLTNLHEIFHSHYLGSWMSRKIIKIEAMGNKFLIVIGSRYYVRKKCYLLLCARD